MVKTMRSTGVIVRYMDLRKVLKWWFNIPLLVFHLAFMVVGTAIGKIKWFETLDRRQDRSFLIMLSGLLLLIEFNISMYRLPYHWWSLIVSVPLFIVGILEYRCIRWRRVWRAAQASHVRLVLERMESLYEATQGKTEWWDTANFGYPEMEIQAWSPDWNDGIRFEYREPTFETSPEFITAMIEYAEAQVGKRYDTLQLFSYGLNFIPWLFYWKWWGQEKLKWLNLRGGREVCSSGITACLRSADNKAFPNTVYDMNEKDVMWIAWIFTTRECRYDTAMVMPCMFVISEKWRVK